MESDEVYGHSVQHRRETEPEAVEPVVQPRHGWYIPIKMVVGWFAALGLLIIALPVILVAAIVVKLTSTGPAFYFQSRVGHRGRRFTIVKLRTMVQNAEAKTGPVWSPGSGDTRVTRVGRFLRASHIDEFPQLFNVLCGHMCLVGPRPERPEIVSELERKLPYYSNRHEVRPGIGGLAQLNLPADSSLESVRRKLVHDLFYVRSVNLLLDLKILLFTAGLLAGHVFRAVWNLVAPPRIEAVDDLMRSVCGADSALMEIVPEPQLRDTDFDVDVTSTEIPVLQPVQPR